MATDTGTIKSIVIKHADVGSVYLNAESIDYFRQKSLMVFDSSYWEGNYSAGPKTTINDFLQVRRRYVIDGYFYDENDSTDSDGNAVSGAYNKMMMVGSMVDVGGFAYLNWGDMEHQQVNFTQYRVSESADEFDRYRFHLELVAGSKT